MLGPSRGLTYEETTHFIAELEQRWREVQGEEKERLAWAMSIWLKMVAGNDGAGEQPSISFVACSRAGDGWVDDDDDEKDHDPGAVDAVPVGPR